MERESERSVGERREGDRFIINKGASEKDWRESE
jgi:hypothetical protein